MKKAILLLSGGLDSTTVLAIALDPGYSVSLLSFLYGQKHDFEIEAAKAVADYYNIKDHHILNINLGFLGSSALTDNIEVPKGRNLKDMSSGIPVTYVPARNTIFLSYALALAEVKGAFNIFIGVNALDYSGYPDCRPEYIDAFQTMGRLATKVAVEADQILYIHSPLIKMKKSEIIKTGLSLGVDYSITHTCYDPIAKGKPCGDCDACLLRLKGFEEIDARDPLNYPKNQK